MATTTTVKENKKRIGELHFTHQLWIKELEFYKDELAIFNKRLKEVAGMYTNKKIMANVEHFQNQFIIQKENADILMHDVNKYERSLAAIARRSTIAIDHRSFPDHPELRNRMNSFIKIYKQLKNEYLDFLSPVM